MPYRLQVLTLKREIQQKGVEPDTVDLDALVDPTLSYPENRRNVLDELGINPLAHLSGKRAAEVEAGQPKPPRAESPCSTGGKTIRVKEHFRCCPGKCSAGEHREFIL